MNFLLLTKIIVHRKCIINPIIMADIKLLPALCVAPGEKLTPESFELTIIEITSIDIIEIIILKNIVYFSRNYKKS